MINYIGTSQFRFLSYNTFSTLNPDPPNDVGAHLLFALTHGHTNLMVEAAKCGVKGQNYNLCTWWCDVTTVLENPNEFD